MGERKGTYRDLVEKPEERVQLGRLRRSWEDNIKIDLREVGWRGIGWIDLAENRDMWRAFVNTVTNIWVP
jgi:hypothetical protein